MRKLRFLLVSSAVGDFGRPQRPAWLALAVVAGGLTVGASMTLLRFFVIRLRLPCIVALPVVSIVGEALRDHIGWDLAGIIGEVVSLAITQSDQRIVRQIAELGGASAIAWIVAVVNGFLVDWMSHRHLTQPVRAVRFGEGHEGGAVDGDPGPLEIFTATRIEDAALDGAVRDGLGEGSLAETEDGHRDDPTNQGAREHGGVFHR